MRDMLERLHTISEENDTDSEFCGPEYDEDKLTLSHEAVIFENSSEIDDILKEAHSLRKEISLLQLEVERLNTHNERYATSVKRLTLLKKDSDSIAKRIQQRGEALYTRLQALGEEKKQLEDKEGPNSAVSRIARVQYDTLMRAFHDVMGGEGWAELSQSLQPQGGRSSRWAMCEIKGRHKELVDLEARLKEVHDLFLDMAMLVEEQGCKINTIEANVCATVEYVEKINDHMKKALQYKRKNPFRHFCPCLPCWKHNQTF
ncbi:Syntaxin-11 [Nibea albiflora]|uniref:Syntaxin-11 n=1 Tax=Nibea albiflora TaxID=240163 RepID=A0ACB7FBY8_NIBAL|nr:Syntaxin-11 [Nibea albiflora]